nr:MAG TPA: hypothetical protein [Caudoviricetes sp.]
MRKLSYVLFYGVDHILFLFSAIAAIFCSHFSRVRFHRL